MPWCANTSSHTEWLFNSGTLSNKTSKSASEGTAASVSTASSASVLALVRVRIFTRRRRPIQYARARHHRHQMPHRRLQMTSTLARLRRRRRCSRAHTRAPCNPLASHPSFDLALASGVALCLALCRVHTPRHMRARLVQCTLTENETMKLIDPFSNRVMHRHEDVVVGTATVDDRGRRRSREPWCASRSTWSILHHGSRHVKWLRRGRQGEDVRDD